jgi:hypothetical protein
MPVRRAAHGKISGKLCLYVIFYQTTCAPRSAVLENALVCCLVYFIQLYSILHFFAKAFFAIAFPA